MLTLPSQLCIRSRIKPRFLSTRESPFTHTYRQYLKCEVLNGEPHTSASFAVCPAVSPVDRRLHPPALTEIHSEWSEEEISPHLCCFYFIFSLSPAPPPSRPLHLLLEEWVWKDKMLHQQQPSGVSAGEPQVSETQRPPQPPRHRPTLQVIDQMGLVQMPGLLRWLIRQAVHTMCSVCCGFKSSLLYLWRLSDFSDSP